MFLCGVQIEQNEFSETQLKQWEVEKTPKFMKQEMEASHSFL